MLTWKRLLIVLMSAGFLLMIGCESDDEIEDIEEEVEESSLLRPQQLEVIDKTA